MGWFWNSSPGSGASSSSSSKPADAFSHLSPEVRDFLEREAPIKPSHSSSSSSSSSFSSSSSSSSPPPAPPSSPPVLDPTKHSKYGSKYADIWAQYKPLSTVESEARTPSMAVSDVYESYRTRKTAVGKAAMENCAFENAALVECWRSGGTVTKLLRGCSAEHSKLGRCFMNQQEFLRTLGYMSGMARDPQTEERIQMHADRLYRKQELYESEMEENSKAGRPLETPAAEEDEKTLS